MNGDSWAILLAFSAADAFGAVWIVLHIHGHENSELPAKEGAGIFEYAFHFGAFLITQAIFAKVKTSDGYILIGVGFAQFLELWKLFNARTAANKTEEKKGG